MVKYFVEWDALEAGRDKRGRELARRVTRRSRAFDSWSAAKAWRASMGVAGLRIVIEQAAS